MAIGMMMIWSNCAPETWTVFYTHESLCGGGHDSQVDAPMDIFYWTCCGGYDSQVDAPMGLSYWTCCGGRDSQVDAPVGLSYWTYCGGRDGDWSGAIPPRQNGQKKKVGSLCLVGIVRDLDRSDGISCPG